MADLKISQLEPTNSAATGDFFIINKEDKTTQKIDVGALRGSLGGSRSFMINFPTDPGFSFSAPTNAHYIGDGTNDASNSKFIKTTDIYDIFAGVTPITVTMPAGTDSAVITSTYGVSLKPSPAVTSDGINGYANVGFELRCTSNKGEVRWSPGGGANNRFAFGTKIHGPILRWDQYTAIEASVREARSPAHAHHAARSMRVYFTESTDASPTTLTFSLFAGISRMRNCTVGVSTGKHVIHPYKDDDLDEFTRTMINLATTEEDDFLDDAGLDIGFVEAEHSHDFKLRVQRLANIIDETLRWDTVVKNDGAAVLLLEGELAKLFAIKYESQTDVKHYEDYLDDVKLAVLPYCGWKFGFETSGFTVPTMGL